MRKDVQQMLRREAQDLEKRERIEYLRELLDSGTLWCGEADAVCDTISQLKQELKATGGQ